jgi:hypothetical protein
MTSETLRKVLVATAAIAALSVAACQKKEETPAADTAAADAASAAPADASAMAPAAAEASAAPAADAAAAPAADGAAPAEKK